MKRKLASGSAVSFRVRSAAEGAEALEYFNGFHDGFIRRIEIESRDGMAEDRSQSCTGVFDVTIDFAHYNYRKGEEPLQPYDRIVRAEFRNVQDVSCDFREGFTGNTIIRLSVVDASRRKGGETGTEECLSLRLGRNFYLEQERRYEFREAQLFTFTEAEFGEVLP